MDNANFVTSVAVKDPDSGGEVEVYIFKDELSGGMFGVDSSFLEQAFEDDDDIIVENPLSFLRDSKSS